MQALQKQAKKFGDNSVCGYNRGPEKKCESRTLYGSYEILSGAAA